MSKKTEKTIVDNFKLPKYLRLAKGTMFFDTEGADASGVRIYALKDVFVGRSVEFSDSRNVNGFLIPKATDVPLDRNKNNSLKDFGKVDSNLPWYIDTTSIDTTKLSRIITAYKYGILVEADPSNPPNLSVDREVQEKDFENDKKGDRIFVGKNKEMFRRLQNLKFKDLKDFINSFPENSKAKENLMDLFNYELKGYNSLNRPRQEVLDLIRVKLQKYGPGISSVRINED